MAGIQIPVIHRNDPVAPTQTTPINVKPADVTDSNAQASNAVGHTVDALTEQYNKAELEADKVRADATTLDFEREFKTKLEPVKQIDGDPTDSYKQFDDHMSNYEQTLLANENLNARQKRIIQAKLTDLKPRLQIDRDVSQSIQHDKWDENTTSSIVDLKKQEMLSSADTMVLDPATGKLAQDSKDRLQVAMDAIAAQRTDRGRRQGLVAVGPDGKERYTPQLQLKTQKDISDGLYNVIQTLNNTGKVEVAKQLMDEYSGELMPKEKLKLEKSNKDNTLKNDALVLANKFQFHDDGAEQIAKWGDGNDAHVLEVRQKALDFFHNTQSKVNSAQKAKNDNAFNSVSEYIFNRQNGPNKFSSWSDAMNDSTIKRTIDENDLTAKHLTALKKMVEQPSQSDQETLLNLHEAYNAGKFKTMDVADYKVQRAHLKPEDQTRMDKLWDSARKDSNEKEYQQQNRLSKLLTQSLQESNYISRPNSQGGFDKKNQRKLNDALNYMHDYMSSHDVTKYDFKTERQLIDQVNAYVTKGEPMREVGTPEPMKIQSSPKQAPLPSPTAVPSAKASATPPPSAGGETLTKADVIRWSTAWYKQKGSLYVPSKDANFKDLKKFIKDQGGTFGNN
jgi:hypothetical protein